MDYSAHVTLNEVMKMT